MTPTEPIPPDDPAPCASNDPGRQTSTGRYLPQQGSDRQRWDPLIIGKRIDRADHPSQVAHPSASSNGQIAQPGQVTALDLQLVLIGVAEAIRDIDLRHFGGLSAHQLAAQEAARWEVYAYLDQVWSDLKAAGLQGLDPPTRQSLAGLRDIAGTLCSATDHLKYRS
jgi:hypothetical protein